MEGATPIPALGVWGGSKSAAKGLAPAPPLGSARKGFR